MSRIRRKGRRTSGTKSLSSAKGRDFVEQKLRQYVFALLQEVEVDSELIEFSFALLDSEKRQQAAVEFRRVIKENRLKNVSLDRLPRRPDENDLARAALDLLEEHPELESFFRRLLIDFMGDLAAESRSGDRGEAKKGAAKRLAALQKELGLSEEETRLLELSYVISNQRAFERYLDSYEDMESRLMLASLMTGVRLGRIKKLYHGHSKLPALGLMEKDGRHGQLPPYPLEDTINEYLLGLGGKDLFGEFVSQDKGRTYSLASFPQDQEPKQMVQKILQNSPAHILFYGTPGTGKTEFVRAVAKSLGLRLYWVKQRDPDRRLRNNLLSNVLLALKLLEQDERALVAVDEADELLNTESFLFFNSTTEKGELNNLMDTASGRMVWIANNIQRMDPSTKRRFAYSMHFEPFSAKARKEIWSKLLRRHPLKPYIQGEFLDKITARFQVDLSAMSGFLRKSWELVRDDLPPLAKNDSGKKESPALEHVKLVQKTLLALLTEQERLKRNGAQVPKLQEQQAMDLYDPEVLVTDHNPQEIRSVAQRFLRMSDEQKKAFNLRNLNFLFSGEPGTGKTEFAKHLADDLGKEILLKRASDILNPYVGMSERFIKEAFAEAEREEKILVIDEVDTFLSSRGGHVRSWESSQTNEFLTQMEHYNGILICTTNRVTGLDEAAIRRFNRKVHFGPLDLSGKERLLARLFGPLLWPQSDNNRSGKSAKGKKSDNHRAEGGKSQSLDSNRSFQTDKTDRAFDNYRSLLSQELENTDLLSRLDSLQPLTASDVATVFQRLAFEADITLTKILEDLEREVAYKNKERRVGF